nr:helix-turn-helix transcriptional regulator [uncultured Eubacterium sp.]
MYKKIDKLLKERGITAYQVSKDTGIAQSVISGWKSGRSKPKVDKLKLLADYFNVDINYFLEE